MKDKKFSISGLELEVTKCSSLGFSSFDHWDANSKLENPRLFYSITPNLEQLIEQFKR